MEKYLNSLRKPMSLIDAVNGLTKKEMIDFYSPHHVDLLKILVPELIENETVPNKISESHFAELLHSCYCIRKKWSKKLGETIIIAADFEKNNRKDLSIEKLKDFMLNCPVPYFKKHANNQMSYYQKKENGISE